MRILVDCDGVLSDLVGDLCDELAAHGYSKTPEDFVTYDFAGCCTREELVVVRHAMCRPGFVQNMTWYEGASEFLSQLRALGDEVVAVTKPFPHSPTWAYERQLWLEGHVDKVVQTAHKELVRGDVLIEDCVTNLEKWHAEHWLDQAFLLDRPWNRGAAGTRVHSYIEILRRLNEGP